MIAPPLDTVAAARLASCFRLLDIVCVGLEAKHLTTEDLPDGAGLGWETPPGQIVWDLDGDVLKVVLPFCLFIHAQKNGETKDAKKARLAEISLVMRIEYAVNRGVEWSDKDVPHYVGVCSYLHAWPYFRADVQSLSTKLGFPPLLLPVIVSGHAAMQSTVLQLSEVKNAPPLPRKQARTKAKLAK
ncbi:MAG: hypothetical protein ACHREM_20685 [Polyangiales bacterium]